MLSADFGMPKNLTKLSCQELQIAHRDFSNIVGSVVCKGTIKDGPEVSIIPLCAREDHWTSQYELLYQKKVAFYSNIEQRFFFCLDLSRN